MGKYIAALFFPCLLVILFSKATYYPIIGLVLTVALIAASVYRGYTDTFLLIVVDAFSMTIGYMISRNWKERLASKDN
ncbi:CsbA family protein [Niallia circulans]|uniref:CsbA family protein n=1 Tax=Niallia circulans TaxID=1397 RepID=UPI0026EE5ED7|nr:CsbA family protein [Niallia circulans]